MRCVGTRTWSSSEQSSRPWQPRRRPPSGPPPAARSTSTRQTRSGSRSPVVERAGRLHAGRRAERQDRAQAKEHGSDRFEIEAHSLPPNRDYAIFLIQQAGAPFGAAEYIGDFSTDDAGNAHTNLQLIVQEAFSSTIVNGVRTRADLNRIGVWFADPAGDDFCPGAGGAPTPFDGDGSAGVQVFNSANADPLPLP
jgi:hypothetical protein